MLPWMAVCHLLAAPAPLSPPVMGELELLEEVDRLMRQVNARKAAHPGVRPALPLAAATTMPPARTAGGAISGLEPERLEAVQLHIEERLGAKPNATLICVTATMGFMPALLNWLAYLVLHDIDLRHVFISALDHETKDFLLKRGLTAFINPPVIPLDAPPLCVQPLTQ